MIYRLESILTLAALFLLLSVVSCSDTLSSDTLEGEEIDYAFTLSGTKGGSLSDTTYRAMLLSAYGNPGVYPYLTKNGNSIVPSGSYRAYEAGDTTWLAPCQVNTTTGEWIADSHEYGLRAERDKYYLTLVCPAVAPVQYKWNQTTRKYEEWGFLHNRQPLPSEPLLYISSPTLINSLKGNHLVDQLVYDVPSDVVLKERRARVKLQIKCGDDLLSATVNKIGWSNYYESCYYNLRLDTLDNFTLSGPSDTVFVSSTPVTVNNGQTPVAIDSVFCLFPLNYPQTDEHTEYVYEVPEIDLYVAQGLAKLKLFHNVQSQYDYTYTITVNSAYVTLSVTAALWNDFSNKTTTVDSPPQSYTFPIIPALWNDRPGQNGTIN